MTEVVIGGHGEAEEKEGMRKDPGVVVPGNLALVAGGIERKERKTNGLQGVVMIVGGMMVAGDLEVLHPEEVLRLEEVLHLGEILVIEMVGVGEHLPQGVEMVVVPGEEEKLLRQEEALHLGVEETVLLQEEDLHPEETLEIARMVVDPGDLDLGMNQEVGEVEILTVVLQGEVEETLETGEGLHPDVVLLLDVALLPEEISGEMLLIVMEVEPGDEEVGKDLQSVGDLHLGVVGLPLGVVVLLLGVVGLPLGVVDHLLVGEAVMMVLPTGVVTALLLVTNLHHPNPVKPAHLMKAGQLSSVNHLFRCVWPNNLITFDCSAVFV